MADIFVNLKRFEVPRTLGGLCPMDNPVEWIESVIAESVELGLGKQEDIQLVYLLPESLIPVATRQLGEFSESDTRKIQIGCQGVHWQDISPGVNFGAFTTSLPATSARNLGATWAIVGHSEERRAKLQILQIYDPSIDINEESRIQAAETVDYLVQAEVKNALAAGMHVLLCVGETAEERGDGPFEEQKSRIETSLRSQLLNNLTDVGEFLVEGRQLVIGYEPIWAIGPGKTPPGKEYISFVSAFIREVVSDNFGFDTTVVYGGGLKEENAGMIASIETIGGGLVALTRFTGEIGFYVPELIRIVDQYLA
jgi:triosephosphate isomerase